MNFYVVVTTWIAFFNLPLGCVDDVLFYNQCVITIIDLIPLTNTSGVETKLKIFVAFIQIVMEMGSVLDVFFPDIFTNFLGLFSFFNIDFLRFFFFDLGCEYNINFYTHLVFDTVAPVVLVILVICGNCDIEVLYFFCFFLFTFITISRPRSYHSINTLCLPLILFFTVLLSFCVILLVPFSTCHFPSFRSLSIFVLDDVSHFIDTINLRVLI